MLPVGSQISYDLLSGGGLSIQVNTQFFNFYCAHRQYFVGVLLFPRMVIFERAGEQSMYMDA